jgi:hypothetical protein
MKDHQFVIGTERFFMALVFNGRYSRLPADFDFTAYRKGVVFDFGLHRFWGLIHIHTKEFI